MTCIIERKATLDENCFEGRHKKLAIHTKSILMYGQLKK